MRGEKDEERERPRNKKGRERTKGGRKGENQRRKKRELWESE